MPRFNFGDEGFRRIMRRWGPVVASSSIFSIIQIIAMRFASGIDDMGVAGLQNAILFWQLPMGIFSVSVSTVMFPRMSRQSAAGDEAGLKSSISLGLELLLVLLVPSTLVLIFLGKEIVAIAYQRYLFTADDTIYTVRILIAYAYGLFSVGAYNFMQRYHFSQNRYKTVTISAAGVACIDVALSLWWKSTSLGVSGLAMANTVSFSVGFLWLFIPLLRQDGWEMARKTLGTVKKLVISLVPGGMGLYLHARFMGAWWINGASLGNVLRLLSVATIFTLLTLLMYRFTAIEAVSVLLKRGRKR